MAEPSAQPDPPEPPFTERVLAIVRLSRWPRDCRDIVELQTGTLQLAPAEAHRLVQETPGSLHLLVGTTRINLLPARADGVLYVRTLPTDSPKDPLLDLPEVAD